MIPKLTATETLNPQVQAYVTALTAAGFTGDIEVSYASRLAVATDNSVYQQLPAAVLLPKSAADVQLICSLAQTVKF